MEVQPLEQQEAKALQEELVLQILVMVVTAVHLPVMLVAQVS